MHRMFYGAVSLYVNAIEMLHDIALYKFNIHIQTFTYMFEETSSNFYAYAYDEVTLH